MPIESIETTSSPLTEFPTTSATTTTTPNAELNNDEEDEIERGYDYMSDIMEKMLEYIDSNQE